jgi:TPP-dependent pyruvate/acetoin dehydrogenase alpha subunit
MTPRLRPNSGPDGATLVEIYRRMRLIRTNDEMIQSAARTGKMNLIYYSPQGQEVIPSALSVHLTDEDYVCTIYRGIHDQLAKGVPSKLIWAEYAGRFTGTCKGKGGPMHITYPTKGVMVTTGIVGSAMPIATGLALASQLAGDGRITVANFGDGASNIGAFHEALNLASIWKLPVVFVCQNNRYAEHSKYERYTAGADIAGRAQSYAMPGIAVDGNDPAAMWRAAGEAVERARAGDGPTLIEAKTFRFCGHLLGDDSSYIPADEMAAAKAADPLPKLRAALVADGHATMDQLDALDAAIRREVEEARDFALSSPWPDAAELTRDVLGPPVVPNITLKVPA